MLKIKDNVDLKELEKYKIYPEYDCNTRTGQIYISGYSTEEYKFDRLVFKKERRKLTRVKDFKNGKFVLEIDKEKITELDLDKLYDLIKADLVEKS